MFTYITQAKQMKNEKMNQFVRSNFSARPSEQFEKQWPELQKIWL